MTVSFYVRSREMKKRPRRVLTPDGKFVLNIWFVPHQTEQLVMYKTLSDEECAAALTRHLEIISALHDILHNLCAHARLGSGQARMGSQKMEFVSADWGGNEGIGSVTHYQNASCKIRQAGCSFSWSGFWAESESTNLNHAAIRRCFMDGTLRHLVPELCALLAD